MSEVLVTGMSGTGKSSALAELGRRGWLESVIGAPERTTLEPRI
jgi:predicted ATPase